MPSAAPLSSMATAGNGSAPYESGGAGKELSKSASFRPDITEEPQDVSQEPGQNALEEEIASCVELMKTFKATDLPISSLASPQHPATMENLPDELLLNIFIRLLAKQLAQMRSVSKSWHALLSQSSFVKYHLNHSIHHNDQVLLVWYEEHNPSSDSKPFKTLSCRSHQSELTDIIKLPVNPRHDQTDGIRVIDAVNGLICSSYGDSIIHIWNPSLSAMLTLPPFSTPPHGHRLIGINLRFGFDPKTDDYKVIKLTRVKSPNYFGKWWLPVEVYSMRKGSWELITERFPSHIIDIYNHDDVLCVDGHDGHLHWLGCTDKRLEPKTIVAFDLGSESFREIPLPYSTIVYGHERCNSLGVLGGKLCVMSDGYEDNACEVWVMDEYGVVESWVKRHVFSHLIVGKIALGFTSHSELLIDDKYRLILYNPLTNKQNILENYDRGYSDKIVEYVDSLVWVTPGECEMVVGARQI